jgi:hypothetical protein
MWILPRWCCCAMTPEQNADLLNCFPRVRHAFAYGSAAFAQPGLYERTSAAPMLDFIFVVDCPRSWHRLVSAGKKQIPRSQSTQEGH